MLFYICLLNQHRTTESQMVIVYSVFKQTHETSTQTSEVALKWFDLITEARTDDSEPNDLALVLM